MIIILLGYMGSGKSLVGKTLASKLSFPFIDLDSYIEHIEQKTISDIFSSKGEIYFRKVEKKYLTNIIETKNNYVLATGGGTPCYANNMKLLLNNDSIITIYLKTDLEILVDRLFIEKENRPLISHIGSKSVLSDFIRKHLFERMHFYNQATIIVNTKRNKPEEIVEEIVSKLF